MAAGAIVEDAVWLGELRGELRGLLAPVFAQAGSRLTAFSCIGALLAGLGDRKSCWQLAEQAGHATPRRMQALLGSYRWDWKQLRGELPTLDASWLPCGPDDLIGPGSRSMRPRS